MRTEFISLLIIPLLIAFYAGHKNGNVAIIFCTYGYNIIIFYTVAITISFILMVITQKVCTKSIKLIELISEGTFLVMSVHYMMLNTVMKIFPEKWMGYNNDCINDTCTMYRSNLVLQEIFPFCFR